MKQLKIALFLLLLTFATIIALESVSAGNNLPITVVCNYSSGKTSDTIKIPFKQDLSQVPLAEILRGGTKGAGCGFEVSIYGVSKEKQVIPDSKVFNVTPTVQIEGSTAITYKTTKKTEYTDEYGSSCSEESPITYHAWQCKVLEGGSIKCDGVTYYSTTECLNSYIIIETPVNTGYTNQSEVVIDPDQFWGMFSLVPETQLSFVRFVEDPFVLLNESSNDPAFWNFHDFCSGQYGCRRESLKCEAKLSDGSVNSSTECVEYPINEKFMSCRGDIIGYDSSGACCGDDDLVDPGFEATPAEKNLYVWEASGETCKSQAWCRRVPDSSLAGKQSFQIIASNQSDSFLSQKAVIKPGTYYLSFWVKNSQEANLTVKIFADDTIGIAGQDVPNYYSDWRHFSIPFYIGPGFEGVTTIQFKVSKLDSFEDMGKKIWLDEVHILGQKPSASQGLADYARIWEDNIDRGAGIDYFWLCYHDLEKWDWIDPVDNQFDIIPADGFNIISDSIKWHACNANGMASNVYSGEENVDLTPEYEVINYEPGIVNPTIITYEELEGTSSNYGFGEDTVLIPDNEFEPGIIIWNQQPAGAPDNCFNNDVDNDEGESDIDCGDGCRKCFDGQKCFIHEDCISGVCLDDGTGVKRCSSLPPELNLTEYLAMRFMCSNQDEIAEYTECCGSSLGICLNKDEKSQIRRAGNPLHSIFEFPVSFNTINYALLMGLRYNQKVDYNYPFLMTKADSKIYDWTSYTDGYLEFYIAYAVPPESDYLKLIILKDVVDRTPREIYDDTTPDDEVLFIGNINDYITGQIQGGKWMRVRIPIGDGAGKIEPADRVNLISIFAKEEEVPLNNLIDHSKLPQFHFRNIIAVDRLYLIPPYTNNYYCLRYPPGSTTEFNDMWAQDMDILATDIGSFPIGKGLCDNTPGFGWTGTACCGDDISSSVSGKLNEKYVSESYADISHGCVKGYPLRNNSIMSIDYPNDNVSTMFYNTKFYTCNDADGKDGIIEELSYYYPTDGDSTEKVSSSTVVNINPSVDGECYTQGSWYCDFDTQWKNGSALQGLIINKSVSTPFGAKACCPESYCFYGNQSAPYSCVKDQSDYFQIDEPLGKPYFFNVSEQYADHEGNNKNYRCINSTWKIANPKWNPDYTDRGYCPEDRQCYLSATDGCVEPGFFRVDDYCEHGGNWTSRTKVVAQTLAEFAKATFINNERFTIYCDNFDEVLAQVDYTDLDFAGKTAREIIECSALNLGKPCANNFCVLVNKQLEQDEKIYIGTSLNLPVDNVEHQQYSLLRLFKESEWSQGGNVYHIDYCDGALEESNLTKDFVGCKYDSFVSPTDNEGAYIWIDDTTQILIYSKEKFKFGNPQTNYFSTFFKNPITAIFGWARNNFINKYNLNSTMIYLESLGDFRRLYISQLDTKAIRGTVEETASEATLMTIGYQNVGVGLCFGDIAKTKLNLVPTNPGASCTIHVTNDGKKIIQSLHSDDDYYWKDLTSNTRLSTASPASLDTVNSKINLTASIAFNIVTFKLNITPDPTEIILAVSLDYGDGSVYSTSNIPESGIIKSHTYGESGVYEARASLIVTNNSKTSYGIKTVSRKIPIAEKIPEDWYMQEDQSLIIDLDEYLPSDDWSTEITSSDLWLDCSRSGNVITCDPDADANEQTHGTGKLNVTLTYTPTTDFNILGFNIHVTPVNSLPQIDLSGYSPSFAEDTVPEDILDGSLRDIATDEETAGENLSFYILGKTRKDSDLIAYYGCSINSTDYLVCNNFKGNYSGSFNITIFVKDEQNEEAEDSVRINITPVNDAPYFLQFFPSYIEVGINGLRSYENEIENLVGDIDNDISTDISIDCTHSSGNNDCSIFSFDDAFDTVTFESSLSGTVCQDTYVCNVSDGINVSAEKEIIVNVTLNQNTIPILSFNPIPPLSVNEGKTILDINATVTDPDIGETWVFSYFPIQGEFGTDAINFTYSGDKAYLKMNFSKIDLSSYNNDVNPVPEDNDISYQILFRVNDSRGAQALKSAIFSLNRKPAMELAHGIFIPSITDSSENTITVNKFYQYILGAPVIAFNISDYTTFEACEINYNMQYTRQLDCIGQSFYATLDEQNLFNYTFSSKGIKTILLYARDLGGAFTEKNITLDYPDADQPTATINSITVTNHQTGSTSASFTATDGTGISYCGYVITNNLQNYAIYLMLGIPKSNEVYIMNSCTGTPVTRSITYPSLPQGTHNLTFFAGDSVGRLAFDSEQFIVDQTNPTISFNGLSSSFSDNGDGTSSFSITINATDELIGLSNISIKLTDSAAQVYYDDIIYATAANKTVAINFVDIIDNNGLNYDLAVTAKDLANNIYSQTYTFPGPT